MDTQLRTIVEPSQAERLATGFVFTEGPVGTLRATGYSWMCAPT
jgi:hypothetical protein